MAIDITALYCCLDEACKVFAVWEAHRLIPSQQTRQRPGKLSRTEMLFIMVLLHSRGGEKTGIYFADSTKLAVCHNCRIQRHKVFDGLAARGKTSMGEAGQKFRRRSRWNGQMRLVLQLQAALRDQPQGPGHGAEDHTRQHRRQQRAG